MLLLFSPGFIKIYNQHILVAGSKLLLEREFRSCSTFAPALIYTLICQSLAFNLNYFSPTSLIQSLIANIAASFLLVRSIMKRLTPCLWYGKGGLCRRGVLAVVCEHVAGLPQSCLQELFPAPLPKIWREREKGAVRQTPVCNRGLMNGYKP